MHHFWKSKAVAKVLCKAIQIKKSLKATESKWSMHTSTKPTIMSQDSPPKRPTKIIEWSTMNQEFRATHCYRRQNWRTIHWPKEAFLLITELKLSSLLWSNLSQEAHSQIQEKKATIGTEARALQAARGSQRHLQGRHLLSIRIIRRQRVEVMRMGRHWRAHLCVYHRAPMTQCQPTFATADTVRPLLIKTRMAVLLSHTIKVQVAKLRLAKIQHKPLPWATRHLDRSSNKSTLKWWSLSLR